MTAVRDSCYLELALCDQSPEQGPQRGRAKLVPQDPHVVLIPSIELAVANPADGTLHGERLLLAGEVVDASIQNAC